MANEGGVAAVDRALTILDAFHESDQSLTLTEISKRVGFYKSTTLRLAESLEKFGYLRRLEDGAFRLGPKPLFLGSLYQRHFRLAEFVPPVLRQIAAELNEGASFFVREDDKRVCVHRVESARAIRDRWHPEPPPTWVTALPSTAKPGLVHDFARSLAAALGLPYVDALTVREGAAPQKDMQNSAMQSANAYAKLGVIEDAVRPGPVLLVDDVVDSGWTLAVAGWLLRSHGCGPVHPFALAVASARDG